jgi:hypothetical protein
MGLSDLLPDPRTEKDRRNRSFQAWSTDQVTAPDGNQKKASLQTGSQRDESEKASSEPPESRVGKGRVGGPAI